ncbi:MAG: peptidylprolyl isomerase [Patescibacteria group bacterium]|nr:peptidylprolyl isomerase [Patescibacteria group bacterium]
MEKGGTFKLALLSDVAPKTVANFEKKANGKFYDGLTFHRVEDWVVQGGDPLGNGTGGGNMETEINKRSFIPGSLGVARGGDIKISNDSQFFINTTDASFLNEQYTNFGQLIEGADVVLGIQIGDKIKSIHVQ